MDMRMAVSNAPPVSPAKRKGFGGVRHRQPNGCCRCTTCWLLPEQPAGHSQLGWRRSHLNMRSSNEAITCWALWDFLQVNG